MRLGVLDIGSNTGHLLVVDAHGGAAPLPAYSYKEPLRLAEHLVPNGPDEGAVSEAGIDALTAFTAQALEVADEKGCEEILAFATSAVRDSVNADAVLDHVHERTDVRIEVLSGEDEARGLRHLDHRRPVDQAPRSVHRRTEWTGHPRPSVAPAECLEGPFSAIGHGQRIRRRSGGGRAAHDGIGDLASGRGPAELVRSGDDAHAG